MAGHVNVSQPLMQEERDRERERRIFVGEGEDDYRWYLATFPFVINAFPDYL